MSVKIVMFQWNKAVFGTSILMRSGLFALISWVMVACTAPSELSDSAKSMLNQRVTDRWRCLEENNYACAYEFLSPAYREVFSYEMYRTRYLSQLDRRLTGVKVVAYDQSAAVASVRVGVMSRPLKDTSSASRAIAVTPMTMTEAWLWNGGSWWYHENP